MKKKPSYDILLPGDESQLKQLFNINENYERILVMGETSEIIALRLAEKFNAKVDLIVEDYTSLLNAKLILDGIPESKDKVFPKIMEFEKTDYPNSTFDLIFAQASLTRESRKKIIKEMKRILIDGGTISVGEIVLLKKNPPKMIDDLLNWAGMQPLEINEIEKYYSERGFEIITSNKSEKALSEYYEKVIRLFEDKKDELSEQEKSYYKKLIKRISHEANVFLKFGGEKFLSFYAFIARKNA